MIMPKSANLKLRTGKPTVSISPMANALVEVSASPLNEELICGIETKLKPQNDPVLTILAGKPTPDLLRELNLPEDHPNTVILLAGDEKMEREKTRDREERWSEKALDWG